MIEAASLQTVQTKEQLKAAADSASITAVVGTPECSVSVYSYRFRTRGGANESTNSAAALMVPSGDATACQGNLPVVLYGHGTATDKAFSMANLINGKAAQTYFKSKGRLDSEAILLDVDSTAAANDPFKSIKDGFAAAKAAAATEGAAKVVEKYHGTLVPPFCMAAARSYFAAFAK